VPELDPIIQTIGTAYDPAGIMGFMADLGATTGLALAAAAAVALVTGACVEAVKSTIDRGLRLHDIMNVMGDTSEQAAGLALATDAVGISTELVTNKVILLAKGLETSGDKAGNSAKELTNLHIAFRNADGTFMESTELLQSIADHFGNMADGTQKNNELATLFGRNVAGLNDYFKQTANGGMQDFINQAKAMGLALSADQVDRLYTVNESMNMLKDSFNGIANVLGIEFIPFLQGAVNWLEKLVLTYLPGFKQMVEDIAHIIGLPTAAVMPAAAAGTVGGQTVVQGPGKDMYVASGDPNRPWKPAPAGAIAGDVLGATTPSAKSPMTAEERDKGYITGVSSDVMTGFEKAVVNFVNAIKAVPWATVAANFATAGQDIGKAVDWLKSLVPAGAGTSGGKLDQYGVPVGSPGIVDWLAMTFGSAGNPVTFDQMLTNIADTFDEVQTVNGKLQVNLDGQKTLNDKLNTNIDKNNTLMTNLPNKIRDAVITGLGASGK
jgi:hypothetical protein